MLSSHVWCDLPSGEFLFFFTKFLSAFLVSSVQADSYRPFLKSLITDAILTPGTVGRVILMCIFVLYYIFDCTVTLKFCCMYMRCTLKVMERQLDRLRCGPVLRLFISVGSLWLNRNFRGNPVKKRTFWVQKKKKAAWNIKTFIHEREMFIHIYENKNFIISALHW